jgi:hypothetical protein
LRERVLTVERGLDCMDSCSLLLAAAQGANRRGADPV